MQTKCVTFRYTGTIFQPIKTKQDYDEKTEVREAFDEGSVIEAPTAVVGRQQR